MKECDYCSGSGCAFCKAEPEKVEAPEAVEDRKVFSSDEVGEFFFKDRDEADIMARYLNSRCSSDHTCPLLRSKCVTDCPCFKKAEVSTGFEFDIYSHCYKQNIDPEGFYISGFRCGNLMFGVG